MVEPIIVSLTTTPQRIPYLNSVIQSLLKQTRKPDKIILNIPLKSRKNISYQLPLFDSDLIVVNRNCEDLGPITKLLPTLDLDLPDNSIIVTIDDDTYLHPHTLSIIQRKASKYPTSVFSFSGICIGNLPFYWGLESDNTTDKNVDVVEGVHSITYRKWMLDSCDILSFRERIRSGIGDIVDFNDDHIISGYLSSKNIPKISINKRARDYFFDLEHKKLGGISSRNLEFWSENVKIAEYFKNLGYYNCNANPKNTIGLYLFVIPLLLSVKSIILVILWLFIVYVILNTNIKLQKYDNG